VVRPRRLPRRERTVWRLAADAGVGVDPADGTEDGAEHAYTTVALGMDHKLYVAESGGFRESPTAFAKRVVAVPRPRTG
jgi:hypothetical protein